MSLLGDLILDELAKFEPTTKSGGGLESSAIALASAVSLRSYNKHKQTDVVKGFFVRKKCKDSWLTKEDRRKPCSSDCDN